MARWSIALVSLVLGGVAGGLLLGPALHGQNASVTAIPAELTSYRDVVKKVLPGVVSIQAKAKPKAKADQINPRGRFHSDDGVPDELFRRFFQDFGQFQMPDEHIPRQAFGSGVIVDPKGIVLTNFHVVNGADEVEIRLKDGRKFTSKDIHGDRKTDLAIVRLTANETLPYLEMGDSDSMEIGDRVLAVGAPFGLTGTVTAGIISAKGRNGLNVNMYEDFLQTDAAINPGNSGGPLVNLEGKVVGINSAIKSRTGGFQGVGLAIASNLAKSIVKSLETEGVVHRGYLGVQVQDLSPEVAARLEIHEQGGVVVGQVFDGAPAAKAGIQEGDVITRLAGKPVKDGRDLQHIVIGLPLHKPVGVHIVRDGKARDLQVTIEEQPEEYGFNRTPPAARSRPDRETVSLDKLGIEVQDISGEQAGQLGYKDTTAGAVITHVEPDSVAAEQGLAKGMLITKVNKQAVTSAESLREAVEKTSMEQGVLFQIQTPQGTMYRVLKAPANK
jgi:serine protease Do